MTTFGIQFHAVTFCRLCGYYTQKQLCHMPSGRLLVQWAKVSPTAMNWNPLPFSLPSPISTHVIHTAITAKMEIQKCRHSLKISIHSFLFIISKTDLKKSVGNIKFMFISFHNIRQNTHECDRHLNSYAGVALRKAWTSCVHRKWLLSLSDCQQNWDTCKRLKFFRIKFN